MSRRTKLVVLVFCVVKLILHLIADSNSGFQADEFLHIETGNNLAYGYMEFPPMIGILAFFQNLFLSKSVFVHHIFVHLAALLILFIVAKITIELGGKATAVFLALFCILVAPGFGRSQQLFQPVVFSQLCWVLNFYFLTKYVKYLERKDLWMLTISIALAFLTKYDAVFFIFGVSSLLFFSSTRQALIGQQFWWNVLVFILLISPNLIWQYVNDFPVFDMFDRLYETQLDQLSAMDVLQDLFVALNPVTLLITMAAFIFMLKDTVNTYRPLAGSIFLSIMFLFFSDSKAYYFFPAVLTILPFGGIVWEQIIDKRGWLMYPFIVCLSIGIFLVPFGMPIFPLESYLEVDYPKESRESVVGGQYNVAFAERYSADLWKETLQELKSVYESLPPTEQDNSIIWGKHYAQAGAVSLMGPKYDLPKAFSLHGSFYNWVPLGKIPATTICLSYEVGDFFDEYFVDVIKVKSIYNPYADNEEELYQHIYLCRGPKQSFDQLKSLFAHRVFE